MCDRNLIIDWILMAAAILIAIAVVFTYSRETFGAGGFTVTDGDFGKSLTGRFTVEYEKSSAPASVDTRPIMLRLTASWCGPCKSLDKILTPEWRSKQSFRLEDCDVDENGWHGVSSIPAFQWRSIDGRIVTKPWNSPERLISEWRWSQNSQQSQSKPNPASTVWPSTKYYSNNSGAHWSHPGSISGHLRNDHGVNPSGMSYEEMLSYHDALHNSGRGAVRHRKRNR